MDDKKWKNIRLAAEIVFRSCGNVTIESEVCDIFDLLVKEDETGLRFGLKVTSSSFADSTTLLASYIEVLENTDFRQDKYRLPIAVMCINSNDYTARIGFVLTWNRLRPVIHRNISLYKVNQKNWSLFVDKLKSMDDTIRMLSMYGLKVIKKIKLDETDRQGHHHRAEFVYLRDLTEKYKMLQKEVTDEKEKWDRMMYGIPEDEYPNDGLDKLILKKVKEEYPSATMRSSLLLFSTELRDLALYTRAGVRKKQYTITIEPDLTQIEQNLLFVLNGFETFHFDIEMFIESPFDYEYFIENNYFETYDLNGWLNVLENIKTLSQSMHKVGEVVM